MFEAIGKILVVIGGIFIAVGILFIFFKNIPLVGKLPGDILIQKKNFSFYFPVSTSILISIILSIVFYLFSKR
jgi:hypothetical protein